MSLNFKATLSFAQELREDVDHIGKFVPASSLMKDPHVHGKASFSFDKTFKTLEIDLQVNGKLTHDREVALSHLHLDTTSATGPLTVNLFPSEKNKERVKVDSTSFHLKTILTNDDVIPRQHSQNGFSTNTIASLYTAAKAGNLYIDVHGHGPYILGMIRGQVYG